MGNIVSAITAILELVSFLKKMWLIHDKNKEEAWWAGFMSAKDALAKANTSQEKKDALAKLADLYRTF